MDDASRPRGRASSPLQITAYRRLYAAQVISLAGTGLTTIGLALLAYDLSGRRAGSVVGIALALKMVAYIGVAPIAAAYTQKLDRKRLLIGLDLVRAAVVVLMPLVTAVWQIYAMIFLLNACAAAFTPTFQALIPAIVTDEEQYAKALSLSRVAYVIGDIASPALAAMLLLVVSYDTLFLGDGLTFLASAAVVATVVLPARGSARTDGRSLSRITRGTRRYLQVAELRGLLALNVAVACASAVVIVNTVVYVREELGRGDGDVAVALGISAAGSLALALAMPALLRRSSERRVMMLGATLIPVGLLAITVLTGWAALLAVWLSLGVALAAVQTPAGLLVQRAVRDDDGPELFAAQFALSHACWLLSYPIAGVLGATAGLDTAAAMLAALSVVAVIAAARLWQVPSAGGSPTAVRPPAAAR